MEKWSFHSTKPSPSWRKLFHGEDAAEGPTKLITVDKMLRAYEADLRPGRRGHDA